MAELDDEIKVEEIPLTEVTVYHASTPNDWIQTALDKGLPIEHLERLMVLKKDWDAQQARKAFDEAMMNFQSQCPIIKKTKEGGQTKGGVVAYMYAPLESIVAQSKELLGQNGFSYLIKTEFINSDSIAGAIGRVKAICIVRHKAGHEEESVMIVPLMTKTGVMSDAQVVAATTTFAKRYAFCNAFGIMTMDDDTDAIDDEAKNKFAEILKEWWINDHLRTVESGITSKAALYQFFNTLPNIEQLTKFKELLQKIDRPTHSKLWADFQRQTATSADDWLNKLSQSKLIKE